MNEEEEEIVQKTLASNQETLKIYFYPQQKGEMEVQVNIKPNSTASEFKIGLDESSQVYELNIPANATNENYKVGKFNITALVIII